MFGARAQDHVNVVVINVFEKMMVHSSDAEAMTDGVVTGGRSDHN